MPEVGQKAAEDYKTNFGYTHATSANGSTANANASAWMAIASIVRQVSASALVFFSGFLRGSTVRETGALQATFTC